MDRYAPTAAHGLMGDLRTSALVSAQGVVDRHLEGYRGSHPARPGNAAAGSSSWITAARTLAEALDRQRA